ncbi:unnamed protein product [Prunus armeniaca]
MKNNDWLALKFEVWINLIIPSKYEQVHTPQIEELIYTASSMSTYGARKIRKAYRRDFQVD